MLSHQQFGTALIKVIICWPRLLTTPYKEQDIIMEEPIDFVAEATKSLVDVSFALQHGELSKKLPNDSIVAYMNLTTRENRQFCVKLDSNGFQVSELVG